MIEMQSERTGYRDSAYPDGNNLEEFRFEPENRFVRHPHYREAPDNSEPTEWAVMKPRYVRTMTYLPKGDGTPGPEHHREYVLR